MAIIGTAYVKISAVTTGLRDDIREKLDKSLAGAGESAGQSYADGFDKKATTGLDRTAKKMKEALGGAGDEAGADAGDRYTKAFQSRTVAGFKRAGKAISGKIINMADVDRKGREAGDRFGDSFTKRTLQRFENFASNLSKILGKIPLGGTAAKFGVLGGAIATVIPYALSLTASLRDLSGAALLVPAGLGAIGLAIGTLVGGFKGMGSALKAAGEQQKVLAKGSAASADEIKKANEKAAEAMSQLAPAAQDVVKALTEQSDAWHQLHLDIQQKMLDGLNTRISTTASNYLPMLNKSLVTVAGGFNAAFKSSLDWLNTGPAMEQIRISLDNTSEGLRRASKAMKPLIEGFMNLWQVGSTFMPRLGDAITDLSNRFRDWTQRNKDNGKMFDWINKSIADLKQMMKVIYQFGSGLNGVLNAAQSSGKSFLQILDDGTKKFQAWANSTKGQEQMTKLFESLRGTFEQLAPAIVNIVTSFADVGQAMRPIYQAALPVIVPLMNGLAKAISALSPVLGPLLAGFLVMRTVLMPISLGLKAINIAVTPVTDAFGALRAASDKVGGVTGMRVWLSETKDKLLALPGAAKSAVQDGIAFVQLHAEQAGNALKNFGSNVASGLSSGFGAVKTGAAKLGTAISDGVTSAAGAVRGKAASIGSSIAEGVGSAAGAVRSKASQIGSAIASGVSSGTSTAKKALSDFGTAAANGAGKGLTAVKTGAVNAGSALASMASGGVKSALSGISTLGTKVATVGKAIKGMALTQKIIAAATTVWAGAQALLNVVMSANPLVLIGVAIAALVTAIVLIATKTTWFQTIWSAVWSGIQTAASFAWNSVLLPIFNAFKAAYDAVATGALWFWQNVIEPAWNGISAAISFVWNTIIMPVFDAIKFYYVDVIGGAVLWFWHTVIEPAWNAIGTAISFAWNSIILPVFNALKAGSDALGAAAMWLWNNAIVPAWNGIKDAISFAWNSIIKPVIGWISDAFHAVGDVASWLWHNAIQPAWDGIKNAISTVWGWVQPIFKSFGDAFHAIGDTFTAVGDTIQGVWDNIVHGVAVAVKAVGEILQKVKIPDWVPGIGGKGMSGLGDTLVNWGNAHMADGGPVAGPGGPRDDKVPAMLSDGEFVVNAKAAKIFLPLLRMINAMGLKNGGFAKARGRVSFLAAGGLASAGSGGASAASTGQSNPTSTGTGDLGSTVSDAAASITDNLVPAVQQAMTAALQPFADMINTVVIPALTAWITQINTLMIPAIVLLQTTNLAQLTLIETQWTALVTAITADQVLISTQLTLLQTNTLNFQVWTTQQWLLITTNIQNDVNTITGPIFSQYATGMNNTANNTTALQNTTTAQWNLMTANIQGNVNTITGPIFGAFLAGMTGVQNGAIQMQQIVQEQFAKIQQWTADPIRYAINVPINQGMGNAWNGVNDFFQLDKPWRPVPSFALGGKLEGPGKGGKIRGPGDGTSDSVPAVMGGMNGMPIRVSNGEFVVREKIASRVPHFLKALNAGQPEAFEAAGGAYQKMPGFANGGNLSNAIRVAKSMDGKPYIWGGSGPGGTDCSGYMAYITRGFRGDPDPYRRIGTTHDFPWPGFSPGMTTAFAVGNTPAHMRGTLDGVNVEAGSTPIHYGPPAGGVPFGQNFSLTNVMAPFKEGGGSGFDLAGYLTQQFKPVMDGAKSVTDKFGNGNPATGARKMVEDTAAGATTWSTKNIIIDTAGGGSGGAQWAGVARSALIMEGKSPSLANKVTAQIGIESGGNPTAVNRTDSNWAAGHPSVGLLQVIGGTYSAYKDPRADKGPYLYGVSVDPLANITAGIRYADATYGDIGNIWPTAAGYDNGGWLPKGLTLTNNNTGHPEAIIPEPVEAFGRALEKFVSPLLDNLNVTLSSGMNILTSKHPFSMGADPVGGGGNFTTAGEKISDEIAAQLKNVTTVDVMKNAGIADTHKNSGFANLIDSGVQWFNDTGRDQLKQIEKDVTKQAVDAANSYVDQHVSAGNNTVTFHDGAFQVTINGTPDSVTMDNLHQTLQDWGEQILHQLEART